MKSIFKSVYMSVSATAFLFAGSAFAVDYSARIASRPFTLDDAEWVLSGGIKSYLNMYKGKAYYIDTKASGPNEYALLRPGDDQAALYTLMDNANRLILAYTENPSPGLHAVIISLDGEDIGGIFYRVKDNVLHIDDFAFGVDDDIKKYLLTDWLRKQEPACTKHTVAVRPINEDYLLLLDDLGFILQTVLEAKEHSDPQLYLGLSKTY